MYVILPFVTNVSVLCNLRISGLEMKDNYFISFILLFTGLSHPFLGMGPGPLELGKIASF